MRLAALLVVTGLGLCVLAPTGGALSAADPYSVEMNPALFQDGNGNPYPITNSCMPLRPGTTYLFQGVEPDGPVINQYSVTSQTKEILGVTATGVQDVGWLYDAEDREWELNEVTMEWYAQDAAGNVWKLGEDSRERRDGDDDSDEGDAEDDDGDDDDEDDWWDESGSWAWGEGGAVGGIAMPAVRINGLAYCQEYIPGEAEDWAKVLRENAKVSVEYGTFNSCLKIKEWSTLDSGDIEANYYASGIGLLLIVENGGKAWQELVDVFYTAP